MLKKQLRHFSVYLLGNTTLTGLWLRLLATYSKKLFMDFRVIAEHIVHIYIFTSCRVAVIGLVLELLPPFYTDTFAVKIVTLYFCRSQIDNLIEERNFIVVPADVQTQ